MTAPSVARERYAVLDLSDARGPCFALTVKPESLPGDETMRSWVLEWFRIILSATGGNPATALDGALRVAAAMTGSGGLAAFDPQSLRCLPGLALIRGSGAAGGTWLGVDLATGETRRFSRSSLAWPRSAILSNWDGPALALPGGALAAVFPSESGSVFVFDLSSPFEPRLAAEGSRTAEGGVGTFSLGPGAFASAPSMGRIVVHELSGAKIRERFGAAAFTAAVRAGDADRAFDLASAYVDASSSVPPARPLWFGAISAGNASLAERFSILLASERGDPFGDDLSGDADGRPYIRGGNPLTYALSLGERECAAAIAKALPGTLVDQDDPPLFAAAASGDVELAGFVLGLGADPALLRYVGGYWEDALSVCGSDPMSRFLVERGVPEIIEPYSAPSLFLGAAGSGRVLRAEPDAGSRPVPAPEGRYLLLASLARPALILGTETFWVNVRHEDSWVEGWAPASWFTEPAAME